MSDKQVWLLFSRSRSQSSQIRLWLFLLYLLNFRSFCYQPLIVHYHKPDCLAKWLDCGVRVKATGNCQNFIDCQLYIFSIKIVLWWSQTKVKFMVRVDKTKRKKDCFSCSIFWAPLATRLFDGCIVTKSNSVQSEGHYDGSELHWIFVHSMLLSVPLLSLQPN